MDESTADSSGTSSEALSSPSSAETSPVSTEASSPSQPDAVQSGEQQTATPETAPVFPEEIDSLAGEERRTNWQQLRTRYDDVNRQVGELKPQVEAFAPIQQKLEAWGGMEQVEQAYSLAQSLFAPVTDPNTGQPVLDQNGLPSYSAEPFVERMANESPQTLYEISHRAMNQPFGNNNETVSHEIFRSYYGLDPALIDTYRQIQSPKDAAQFIQNAGQITAEQLVGIPQQYHDAAKSLTPAMWAEVELMAEPTRDQYLAERAEMLEMRSFREEQKAAMQQQQQAEQQATQARVEQAGAKLIEGAETRVIQASMDKLKAEVNLLPDPADNQVIHESIISRAVKAVEAASKADIKRYNDLYKTSAKYEADRDIWRARQARVEADSLAAKVGREYTKQVAAQVKWWNEKLGMARNGTQAAQASAQTRPEFVRTGNPSAQTDQNRRIEPAANNQRFGLSPAEITEQAARLTMERQRANGITG